MQIASAGIARMDMPDGREPENPPSSSPELVPSFDGDTTAPEHGSILHGVLLLAGAHVAAFLITAGLAGLMASPGWLGWGLFIGLTQLVYVVPLVVWMRSKGRPRTVKGIQIAALITFLLNATCFGIGLATFSVR